MSQRSTTLLGYATLIAVIAAVWLLFGEDPNLQQGERGGRLFEGLEDRAADIDRITLRRGAQKTTIELRDQRWQINERGGYSAEVGRLRALILGLARAERREPKTQRRDRFSDLGLGPDALQITLGAGAETLASLSMGKRRAGVDGASLTYTFIEGETRAWLVTELAAAEADPAWWIDRDILSLDQTAIGEIRFETAMLQRGADGVYALSDLAAGEEMAEGWTMAEPARTIAALEALDVKQGQNPITDPVASVAVLVDGGLALTLSLFEVEGAPYIQVSVDGEEGGDAATELAAKTGGWLYQVSPSVADVLRRQRADFVKTPEDAPTTP